MGPLDTARLRTTAFVVACATSLTAAPLLAASASAEDVETAPTTLTGVTHVDNDRVPVGASWTEHYFPSSDGSDVELHADVLRPAHLAPDQPTPVILSVGPYFSHAGQLGDAGYAQTGPSSRFDDLIEGASLMERGYTVVLADLRGYGGSTGCIDWAGPGEQADVVAAVEWAADQPWSTGRVGLYGKSYDAVTGLIGANHEPDGLAAVVAQEPLWDMYNYLFSHGVRRFNHVGTPMSYNRIATIDGLADDSERYRVNAAYEDTHPGCLADNLTDTQDPDPQATYWRERDLAAMAAGSQVPIFVTQGFVEPNTKPEDMQQYLSNHAGEQRGWLGPWEHVRGNETGADGVLRMGREGWFEEVMRFYDEHLLDVSPAVEDPTFVVQDNLGRWRAQDTWPVVTTTATVRLQPGSYVDDSGAASAAAADSPDGTFDMESAPALPEAAQGRGPSPRITEDDNAYYSWSRPVVHDTRITGTPQIAFDADGSGHALVRLYDVAPDGTAVMFDEQMSKVQDGRVSFPLKDTDWTLARGHQLVVGLGTNRTWEWLDPGTGGTVSVSSPTLTLQLQNTRSDVPTAGGRAPYLDTYLAAYSTTMGTMLPGTFNLSVDQGME